MENDTQDVAVGLEIIQRHIDQMLQEVLSKASKVQESIVNRAAMTLVGYLKNCWICIGVLHAWSSTIQQQEIIANSSAAILRVMYDALLQLLYLTHDPELAKARATAYLEFGVIEQHTFMELVINGTNLSSRRIAKSLLRPAAEPHIRSEYQRVKNRYCGKNGKLRPHWYEGTLAAIAGKLGRAEEYSWHMKMLSSAVHAGAFAAVRGPLPVSGEASIIFAAMFVSQAAAALVRVTGIKITKAAKQIIVLNGKDLLNCELT